MRRNNLFISTNGLKNRSIMNVRSGGNMIFFIWISLSKVKNEMVCVWAFHCPCSSTAHVLLIIYCFSRAVWTYKLATKTAMKVPSPTLLQQQYVAKITKCICRWCVQKTVLWQSRKIFVLILSFSLVSFLRWLTFK